MRLRKTSQNLLKKKASKTFATAFALILTLSPAAAYTPIPQIEREALIALYNDTDGNNWTDNSGWKAPPLSDGFAMPGTECDWNEVGCIVI